MDAGDGKEDERIANLTVALWSSTVEDSGNETDETGYTLLIDTKFNCWQCN